MEFDVIMVAVSKGIITHVSGDEKSPWIGKKISELEDKIKIEGYSPMATLSAYGDPEKKEFRSYSKRVDENAVSKFIDEEESKNA